MKNKYIVFVGMGFELIGLILGSIWLGPALEVQMPAKGMWTVGLMVATLIGWFVHMILLLKKLNESDSKN